MEGTKEDPPVLGDTTPSSCETVSGDGRAEKAVGDDGYGSPSDNAKDESDFKVPESFPFRRPAPLSRAPPPRPSVQEDEGGRRAGEGLESRENVSEVSDRPKPTKTAQRIEKTVPVPYEEPSWSGEPTVEYSLEVIKTGTIVDVIPLRKPFLVVGRLAQCDIIMEHPSLSRFHCVIQYCVEGSETHPQGFYAYDLGSTHGSYHNKHLMKPHTYYHLRVGHMLKFGGSTRMLILQGPEEDQEPESDLSVTELKAKYAERARKLEQLEMGELDEEDQEERTKKQTEEKEGSQEESRDIDWGMGEDAEDEEEGDEGENPFASLNEELYLEDPKKTLRGWFEREGYDIPKYDLEAISPGCYKCKLDLPVPGPGGGPLVAVIEHKGKKKEAVIQCALEACRILDRIGVLRQAKHESHERKRRDWAENDYYDSDEDDFLDRTGDVQRKRMRRMKEAGGKDSGFVENYDTLKTKYKEVTKELEELEEKIAEADTLKQVSESSSGLEEDLDIYMHKLKSQVPDKHKRVTWKLRAVELRKDELRLRRLTNVARPLGIPELQAYVSKHGTSSTKQNLKVVSVDEKQKSLQRTTFGATKPKESSFKVHKIFQEDEPVHKPRLRRLDDAEEVAPSPSATIPRLAKTMQPRVTHDTVTERSEVVVPGSSKSKKQEHIYSSEHSIEDVKHSDSGYRTAKSQGPTLQRLEQLGAVNQSGSNTNNETGEDLQGKGDCVHRVSISNEETETNTSSSSAHEWKRPVTPENSPRKKSPSKDTEERPPEKKQRFMGPSLPPQLAQLRAEQGYKKVKKKHSTRKYDDENPNYDTWIPPQQQTGDGRTSLNDKLGY